jgi:hypothetical protein
MTDTAIIERDVVVPAASEAGRPPFSWSAAIAGAFAAAAVTFIIVAEFGDRTVVRFSLRLQPVGHQPDHRRSRLAGHGPDPAASGSISLKAEEHSD